MNDYAVEELEKNNKPLVLIVDDVELNRSFLQEILEDEYKILEASNGMEALKALETYGRRIAIVLLDVIMPGMDGFDVLKQMNQRRWIENIPVVMISADNSTENVIKGYELGVTDYISRPYDSNIIKRRVKNTIILYAKQKNLEQLVWEQIEEKEERNAAMINLLSTIVEFRNGESGSHVLRIRVITEILLKALMRDYKKYNLTPTDVLEITNASAMHDIGKIAIPEEILNKPGRLTAGEFELMKTHAIQGAKLLEDTELERQDVMFQYAHDICRWHHERFDGLGYPDGLSGNEIPICAQVVALADVYDALTSERVYKPAFSHERSIKMILDGECGTFNPELLNCLLKEETSLENQIRVYNAKGEEFFNAEELSNDIMSKKRISVSDQTISLLEQERTRYQFLAALSNEILMDYNHRMDCLSISEKGCMELGIESMIVDVTRCPERLRFMTVLDFENLQATVKDTTPENPFVQRKYLITLPDDETHWYELTVRSMWASGMVPKYLGWIGKLTSEYEKSMDGMHFKNFTERDPLTNLYNGQAANKYISSLLDVKSDQEAVILLIDVDDLKKANSSRGHSFGDDILQKIAALINRSLRSQDIAARVGGDEFVIFLPDIKSRKELGDYVRYLDSVLCAELENYRYTVSIETVCYPQDGDTYESLLDKAEAALRAARLN